ncbi:MAG: very short patch repair endonuclease [Sphingomonadaceae bacterium]
MINRRKLFDDVPERTRRTMRAILSTETKPERQLRSMLHKAGYRFRKNVKGMPGSPDIAFPARRKVIFVHGCFWHQHPGCHHAKVPRTRPEYWLPKLTRTATRDKEDLEALAAAGWSALSIWECELQRDPGTTYERAVSFIESRPSPTSM